jgi:hypothetical protein
VTDSEVKRNRFAPIGILLSYALVIGFEPRGRRLYRRLGPSAATVTTVSLER